MIRRFLIIVFCFPFVTIVKLFALEYLTRILPLLGLPLQLLFQSIFFLPPFLLNFCIIHLALALLLIFIETQSIKILYQGVSL